MSDGDFEDGPFNGLHCEACGASIDEDDPDQFHEASGYYTCPECGHTNWDD